MHVGVVAKDVARGQRHNRAPNSGSGDRVSDGELEGTTDNLRHSIR